MLLFGLLPLLSLMSIYGLLSRVLRKSPELLGAAFVFWISWVGLVGRVLSWCGLLGAMWAWIFVELLPICLFAVVFRRRGRGWGIGAARISTVINSVATSTRSVWALPVLILGIVALYGVGLVANVTLGQTMDDSLTTYLARAGLWITDGSIGRFGTSDYNFPLVAYPALPSLSAVRWIVLTGSDHLVVLDQWLSAGIAGVLVHRIARQLRISQAISLVTSLLWMSMSVVVLQSQMVLNDLTTSVFILTAVIYGVHFIAEKDPRSCLVALLALLVALGTKQTVLFMLLPLSLVFVLGSWPRGFRTILASLSELSRRWSTWAVLGAGLLVALPEYVLNVRDFGNPLGPRESFGYFADTSVSVTRRLESVVANAHKILYGGLFTDMPNFVSDRFPGLFGHVRRVILNAGSGVDRLFGIGWYGLSATSLVLVGLIIGLPVMIRRGQLGQYFLMCVGSLGYIFLFLYTRPNFTPAFARYLLVPITILMLLGSVVLDQLASGSRRRRRLLTQVVVAVVGVLSLYQGTWSLLGNGTRPLIGVDAVWGQSNDELFVMANGFVVQDVSAIRFLITEINRCVPARGAVAVDLPSKFPLSSLFGRNYRRSVRFLSRTEERSVSAARMRELGVDAIVIDELTGSPFRVVPEGLVARSWGQYHLFWHAKGAGTCK